MIGYEILKRALAASREAAGLKQKELAALHYGRSSVANVETGRQNVPRRFWVACDEILGTGCALTDGYDELEALRGEAHGIQIAREALQADPGDVTVWVLLGYLYHQPATKHLRERPGQQD